MNEPYLAETLQYFLGVTSVIVGVTVLVRGIVQAVKRRRF
jgi:hypothetical protein